MVIGASIESGKETICPKYEKLRANICFNRRMLLNVLIVTIIDDVYTINVTIVVV